jgi:N-acetylglucosamine malate deacetylase 1
MPRVLAVMAHPDDIELTCAGTLALLKEAGWSLHFATMTAGDLGSVELPRTKIAAIRRKEAAAAAKILGAGYTCLGFDDLTIVYSAEAKRKVSALIRRVKPDLVITHSPIDYMADHEETSRIVREAVFASAIPNWKSGAGRDDLPACEKLAQVLYADPIDNSDSLGRRISASILVDITAVIATKEQMLAAHASQREWLRRQHGVDEYLLWMRRTSADRARDWKHAKIKFAEGFNAHKGHGFSHDDVLSIALGKKRVKSL